jgi:hypothetical protein
MNTTKTVIAVGVTTTQVEAIKSSAIIFADSELGIKNSLAAVEACIVPWNFEQFEIVAGVWKLAYQTKVECTPATSNKAWERFYSGFANPKPASTTPKALQLAAARVKKEKACKVLIKKHGSAQALRTAASKSLTSGREVESELLMAAAKMQGRADDKAANATLKPRRDKVLAAVRAADDKQLIALEKVLAITVPAKAAKKVKAK